MFKSIGSLAFVLVLGGCAAGSDGMQADGNYPSVSFAVATDYQSAYRRAEQYLRTCYERPQHAYGVQYVGRGSIDDRATTGTLHLARVDRPSTIYEIITVVPAGAQNSKATVAVLGKGKWDQKEMDAAKVSIQTATPVCVPESDMRAPKSPFLNPGIGIFAPTGSGSQ